MEKNSNLESRDINSTADELEKYREENPEKYGRVRKLICDAYYKKEHVEEVQAVLKKFNLVMADVPRIMRKLDPEFLENYIATQTRREVAENLDNQAA